MEWAVLENPLPNHHLATPTRSISPFQHFSEMHAPSLCKEKSLYILYIIYIISLTPLFGPPYLLKWWNEILLAGEGRRGFGENVFTFCFKRQHVLKKRRIHRKFSKNNWPNTWQAGYKCVIFVVDNDPCRCCSQRAYLAQIPLIFYFQPAVDRPSTYGVTWFSQRFPNVLQWKAGIARKHKFIHFIHSHN